MQDAGYVPDADYPDSDLGRALRDVARVIKSDVGLQVAAVDYGDWDMHTDMGTVDSGWLTDKLGELASSMAAFATDLGGRFADVTVVTLTEFGRSLVENGSGGVDHGHGQAVLLLGGGVQGGQVHGTLADAGGGRVGRGRPRGHHRLPADPRRDPREAVPGLADVVGLPRPDGGPARCGQSSGLTTPGGSSMVLTSECAAMSR